MGSRGLGPGAAHLSVPWSQKSEPKRKATSRVTSRRIRLYSAAGRQGGRGAWEVERSTEVRQRAKNAVGY